MNCQTCNQNLIHLLRNDCVPIAGMSELIRKSANKLFMAKDDEERARLVNALTTYVDTLTGSVYKFEQTIFEIDSKGLEGFLHQQTMDEAERER